MPDDDLGETRAALEPTLAATAAVLPWLKKPRVPRYPPEINQRWITAARNLALAWSERRGDDWRALRQAVFALYDVAVASRDADCLALGEALASAVDRLDGGNPPGHLLAALSATTECLDEPTGLEHEAFPLRAKHFTGRLLAAADPMADQQRSPLIDQLFAAETGERLALMREALDALPPDAVFIKDEALLIAEQAELIELYGLMGQARQIASHIDASPDLEHPVNRTVLQEALRQLGDAAALIAPR